MKSAKPVPADASSHRRSQPVRQTRTNPPRSSINAGRVGTREPPASGPIGDQPIDIYPAITHFADTMTALPKELVRHFTLLKEVDAKIFAPQEQLFKLVSAATQASQPEPQRQADAASAAAPDSASMAIDGSSSGAAPSNSLVPAADEANASTGVFDPANIPRRQLFRQTAFKIQEMLVSLEEKNHVISTANDALQRQLTRVEDVWPYLENEFSDEAKWGSTTHWAYPENRGGKAHFERARRDGAAAISAAAQALADEAAARSDARKQAVQAKKNMRNANNNAEADETREKKPSSKSRKAADNDGAGLGITPNGNPQKRRKTEKAANGGTPMERTMSSALGSTASKTKGGSPRGTPAPEGAKKRRALPTGSAPAKKKYVIPLLRHDRTNSSRPATGKTPSATSSPVIGNISEPKPGVPPAPTSAPRPPSARARQNSINSTSETAKVRRPSVTAKATNGTAAEKPEPAPEKDANTAETPAAIKVEPSKKEAESVPTTAVPVPAPHKKENKAEAEVKAETTPALPQPATVTTKSGRASKPSTPALATFQEAAAARASRARNEGKRSRKSSTAQPARAADDDATSSMQEEEEGDPDGDEPTYCYCNSVSYGEMVACDSDDCEREWFHLACVGLKVAPGSKSKSMFPRVMLLVY